MSSWRIHHPTFHRILGPQPTLDLLLTHEAYPFAHEAGVYFPGTEELFITSNRVHDKQGAQSVHITRVALPNTNTNSNDISRHEILPNAIHMANGGVNYSPDHILFCAQGSSTSPAGLFTMAHAPPHTVKPLLTSLHGIPFNSPNDVIVAADGSVWFTDPTYGAEQGYRPPPALPPHVYRFDPATGAIRAVADGLGHPNGLCFSPDERVLYVTDTDKVHGSGVCRFTRPSSIYAFDVQHHHGQPFLCNRRLFAYAEVGIPDGIKCDVEGNVYSGCGDGVHVWSPGGVLLGRILVPGGAANFCFGRGGEMYILNEHRLWRAKLDPGVRGALLGI
ncbi:hypothetical protein F5X68DRAFT_268094 [Plectosphaerella plurivora]|uniref:SMP-30/Gluconolactonase/LRE-like region domain-containing protein n=1 Tax=Plectosphaerella plurivora TaxID=936078 RepID=A0A9P9AEE4_9PEZI|nr:hypothetical protein F5X68DRAFT_268094 [Plectosphaerella plurivora]